MRQNTSHFGVNTAQDDSVLYRLANPADKSLKTLPAYIAIRSMLS